MKITYFFSALIFITSSWAEEGAFDCDKELGAEQGIAALEKFEERFSLLQDLSGSFKQESSLAGMLSEKSEGEFAFKKPGKMRWGYSAPDKQLSISNGDQFWHYEPDIPQVYVGELRGAFQTDLPVAFLLGLGSLSEKFKIIKSCRVEADTWFELKPSKEEGELKAFFIRIRGKTLAPAVAKVIEFGNNETTIHLSSLRKNVGLPDKDFEFEIPKNVDVIRTE